MSEPIDNTKRHEIRRREFIKWTAAGASTASIAQRPRRAKAADNSVSDANQSHWIDCNVYLPDWPFRRFPKSTPSELVNLLREKGVTDAWTGSFAGVFHRDIQRANRRLFEVCRDLGEGLLNAFGTVNPNAPDWREDLRRCDEDFGMTGIRLHPSYHGYDLNLPAFDQLLGEARGRGLVVQLAPWLEDERHHHPLMPVPKLDLEPLPALLEKHASLNMVLLNGFRSVGGEALARLFDLPNFYCDIALVDIIDGLSDVFEKTSSERVLFGSYSPMFYFDCAELKLAESALDETQQQHVRYQAALQVLNS